jgi:hypothetical protein
MSPLFTVAIVIVSARTDVLRNNAQPVISDDLIDIINPHICLIK